MLNVIVQSFKTFKNFRMIVNFFKNAMFNLMILNDTQNAKFSIIKFMVENNSTYFISLRITFYLKSLASSNSLITESLSSLSL